MRKTLSSLFSSSLLLAFSFHSYAQVTQPKAQQQVWFGYFNQSRLTQRFGVGFDLQLKTKDHFLEKVSQTMIGTSISYYPTERTRISFGYAFVNNQSLGKYEDLTQPEHRTWQQAQWIYEKKIRAILSIRLEERYRRMAANDTTINKDYNLNYRSRYMLGAQLPLLKKGTRPFVSFVMNNELYIHLGKHIEYRHLDQNWFFTGLAFYLTGQDHIQLGYMNVIQQLQLADKYRTILVARLSYFQKIDLRKPTCKNK